MDCAAEEPLCSNEQLSAVSGDGHLRLADFDIPELNRYSFVADDASADAADSLFRVLTRIVAVLDAEAQWLTAWLHHETGNEHIRSRVTLSRLAKAGFATVTLDGIGVGLKPAERGSIAIQVLAELGQRLSWAMILGRHKTPQMFMQSPFIETMKACAHMQRLCPSQDFLKQLGNGVAYLNRNSSGMRLGLVVVLPVSLQLTLRRFQEEGMVSQIYRGEQAHNAWS